MVYENPKKKYVNKYPSRFKIQNIIGKDINLIMSCIIRKYRDYHSFINPLLRKCVAYLVKKISRFKMLVNKIINKIYTFL